MTDISQRLTKYAGQLLHEFSNLSDKFADVVKDGANHSVGKLLEAVDDFVEPSSVLIEKLTTAVKEGENKQIAQAIDGLIEPSSVLISKIADALKDGAHVVGEKMMTTLEESIKPDPIDAQTFAEAVKSGSRYASEKMLTAVDELIQIFKAFKAPKG